MAKKKIEEVSEVKEEVKVEEPEVKAEVSEVLPTDIYYLKKELDKPLEETIEEERKVLFKYYKSLSTRNNIMMFAAVAVFIAAFILIALNALWATITGWVLVGTSVIGMVIYHILTRNNYPRMSKHYFSTFWTSTNDYLFQNSKFTDCSINMAEKYQLADMAADRVYKDIVDIASRNIVHGKYNGKDFTFGELAFYKAGAKKHSREVIFVGRHLAFPNSLAIPEGRIIVNVRAEKELDLPNDVEDLETLIKEGNFVVYGPKESDPEKLLGKDVLNRLKSIEVKDSLVNINIVFWSGRTSTYLSYDDSIVAIPFHEPIKMEAYVQLKNNIDEIFDIVSEL